MKCIQNTINLVYLVICQGVRKKKDVIRYKFDKLVVFTFIFN